MRPLSYLIRRGYLEWRLRRLRGYLRHADDCRDIQRGKLLEKLRLNQDSQFGREHGFDGIRTVSDFRNRVPIANYETYRPYIEQVKDGNPGALFGPGTKVLMFSMTSGTTSQSKYVPITNHFFREYRRSWNYWGLATFRDHTDLLSKYTLTLGERLGSVQDVGRHTVRQYQRSGCGDSSADHQFPVFAAHSSC